MQARCIRSILHAVIPWLFAVCALADEVPRDKYLRYVPLSYPRQIRETNANRQLRIYGDERSPRYEDRSPKDGIDDTRGRFFHALALHFAPYLVLNTSNFPMDFEEVLRIQDKRRLMLDHWNVAGPLPELESSETIGLDAIPLDLLESFSPTEPQNPWLKSLTVHPRHAPFLVPFVDFAGDSPESWKREYEDPDTGQMIAKYQGAKKTYVHPLVSELTSTAGSPPLYELVLQYWFFYPLNDADNKHKGDWEHVNVAITPLSRIGKGLSSSDLQGIFARDLSHATEEKDPLVISRVDYYFHSFVMMLDFTEPNAYLPKTKWEEALALFSGHNRGQEQIARQIRERAWLDANETIPNTHPVVYIGADSKGAELILYPPGHRNRDGHGSYPFRGLFKDIGPASSGEEIRREFNPREHFRSGKALPAEVIPYDQPEMITILPDWERIIEPAYRDPEMRRRWYWMLVPIRWGYPAIHSKFAGIVPHAETGNLASISPPFHVAWNRPKTAAGTAAYEPQLLKGIFPVSPVDTLQNDWGWINAIVVPLTTLPPLDVLFKGIASPAKGVVAGFRPVYYPSRTLPYRFFSMGVGAMTQFMSAQDWNELYLNKDQFPEILSRLTAVDPQGGQSIGDFADAAFSPVYQVHFYLGERFVTETSLRHATSDSGFDVQVATRPEPFRVRGQIENWDLNGTLRYNLLTENVQPFLRLGYGWSWYRLRSVTTDGVPLSSPESGWVDQPSIFPPRNLWPNQWLLGLGVELLPVRKRSDVFDSVTFSAKFDLTYAIQGINVDFESPVGLGLRAPQATARRFGLSLTGIVSF